MSSPLDQVVSFSDGQRAIFAAHTQEVMKRGDALTIAEYRQRTLGAKTLAAAAVVAPAAIMAGSPGAIIIETAAALGIPAAYAWMRRSFVDLPRGTRRMNIDAQVALGERYELFRMPAGDNPREEPARLVMRYHGPYIPKDQLKNYPPTMTTSERVQRIAAIAEEHGVSEMLLDPLMAMRAGHEPAVVRMHEVLKRRGIKIDDTSDMYKYDYVATATPTEWQKPTVRAQKIVSTGEAVSKPYDALTEAEARIEAGKMVTELVGTLRKVSPMHPIVRIYDDYAKHPEGRNAALKTAVQQEIERSYSEIVPKSQSARHDAKQVPAKSEVGHLKEAAESSTSPEPPVPDLVPWRAVEYHMAQVAEDGAGVAKYDADGFMAESIAASFRSMTSKELRLILGNPEVSPTQSVKVLSELLMKQLHQPDRPLVEIYDYYRKPQYTYVTVELTPSIEPRYAGFTTQERLLDTGSKAGKARDLGNGYERQKNKKIAVGGLLAGVIAVGSFLGSDWAEDNYNHQLTYAHSQIAAENLLDPRTADIPFEEYRKRAEENSVSARIWGHWKDFQEHADDIFKSRPTLPIGIPLWAEQGIAADTLDLAGRPGEGRPVYADWKLEPHGGMSTEGYWAIDTSYKLHATNSGLEWVFDSNAYGTYYDLDAQPPIEGPNIRVSRTLSVGDAITRDGKTLIKVPVLYGTEIIAANIDGKEVDLKHLEGATKAFEIATEELKGAQGKLEYWIQPAVVGGVKPFAVMPLQLNGDVMSEDLINTTHKLRNMWEERIPGFWEMPKQEQMQRVREYVEGMAYRLDPFGKDFNHDADPLVDYIERLVERSQADCKVAGTIMSLNSLAFAPGKGFNLVTGYSNKNNSSILDLNSREGHTWTTDEYGNIIDATPRKGITDEDAAWLAGRGVPTVTKELPGNELPTGAIILGGLGILGVLGYGAMPKIQQYRRRTLKKLEQKMQTMGPRELFEATEVVDAVLYDGKKNVTAAAERARNARTLQSTEAESSMRGVRVGEIVVPEASVSIAKLHRFYARTELRPLSITQKLLARLGLGADSDPIRQAIHDRRIGSWMFSRESRLLGRTHRILGRIAQLERSKHFGVGTSIR